MRYTRQHTLQDWAAGIANRPQMKTPLTFIEMQNLMNAMIVQSLRIPSHILEDSAMTQTQTEINIQARKDAAEVVKLCSEGRGEMQPPHFWKCLAELAQAEYANTTREREHRTPEQLVFAPMTEAEAAAFETGETMPAGQYSGVAVCFVPPAYLAWWADNNSFNRQLDRYVKSKRFQDKYNV